MKAKILNLQGTEKGTIDLPKEFSSKVRTDIILKVIEAKKKIQPYAPSPVAGNSHSASGILKHHRHVWKSQYGRGMSRIPRKVMSRRGSQFNWVGATSPNAVGGRRAHPPKAYSMINLPGINKNEMKIAFISALSATTNEKYILDKYSTIEKVDTNLPLIISISNNTKTKDFLSGLKKILGDALYKVAIKEKKIRAGIGKLRGRKYKSNAGMLLVIGNDEKIKTGKMDVVKANTLSVVDLAKNGPGRLTVYTEKAIKDLENRFKGKIKKEENKK